MRGRSPPRPLLSVPNVTVHPSTTSVPITVLLYNGPRLCGFNVAIKGLRDVPTSKFAFTKRTLYFTYFNILNLFSNNSSCPLWCTNFYVLSSCVCDLHCYWKNWIRSNSRPKLTLKSSSLAWKSLSFCLSPWYITVNNTYYNQAPISNNPHGPTQPGHPSVGRRNEIDDGNYSYTAI